MLKLLAGQLTSGLEQQAWRRLRKDGRGFKDAVLCSLSKTLQQFRHHLRYSCKGVNPIKSSRKNSKKKQSSRVLHFPGLLLNSNRLLHFSVSKFLIRFNDSICR